MSLKGTDAILEVFTVLSEEDVQRRMEKKLKKAKKKARSDGGWGVSVSLISNSQKHFLIRLLWRML